MLAGSIASQTGNPAPYQKADWLFAENVGLLFGTRMPLILCCVSFPVYYFFRFTLIALARRAAITLFKYFKIAIEMPSHHLVCDEKTLQV